MKYIELKYVYAGLSWTKKSELSLYTEFRKKS